MMAALEPPTKEVDIDFLVFVERYATDLLKWDILTFFGHNPSFKGTVFQIAGQLSRSSHSIRPELGDLALLGILDKVQQVENGEAVYQLTQEPTQRRLTLKFANSQ